MGYSGPGYGILSLVVSEKYIWCLDYKGGLFCSALPGARLRWQKFEDAVQQVAVSPSGWPPWWAPGPGLEAGINLSGLWGPGLEAGIDLGGLQGPGLEVGIMSFHIS